MGARAARHLVADAGTDTVLVHDTDRKRQAAVVASLGDRAEGVGEPDPADADLVLLAAPRPGRWPWPAPRCRPAATSCRWPTAWVRSSACSTCTPRPRERGVVVAVGAGFGPGLSCVLARHAAGELDQVDEVHVAHHGTGGPACARQHHAALRGVGLDWRDHSWRRRPPGSGRELCFFPDPIGGSDCYRAALPGALLLVPAFPGVGRVTARLAATRRDRLTAGLPMLRRPHAEGRIGGLRVEVRGRRGQVRDTVVLGAVDRPAVAAGTVAAVTVRWLAAGRTLTTERAGWRRSSSRCRSSTSWGARACGPRCSRARDRPVPVAPPAAVAARVPRRVSPPLACRCPARGVARRPDRGVQRERRGRSSSPEGDDARTTSGGELIGPAAEGIDGVEAYRIDSHAHTEENLTYQPSPPTGGEHFPVPATCGFYETDPPTDELIVHDLEHGAIWVAFDPDLADAQVRR